MERPADNGRSDDAPDRDDPPAGPVLCALGCLPWRVFKIGLTFLQEYKSGDYLLGDDDLLGFWKHPALFLVPYGLAATVLGVTLWLGIRYFLDVFQILKGLREALVTEKTVLRLSCLIPMVDCLLAAALLCIALLLFLLPQVLLGISLVFLSAYRILFAVKIRQDLLV